LFADEEKLCGDVKTGGSRTGCYGERALLRRDGEKRRKNRASIKTSMPQTVSKTTFFFQWVENSYNDKAQSCNALQGKWGVREELGKKRKK